LEALEGLQYIYFDYSSDTWPQGVQDANARFLARYPGKSEMEYCVYIAYEAMNVYFQAMEKAGSVEPEAVLKVFDDPDWRFSLFGNPNAYLGGIETYGARRQLQMGEAWGKITNGQPEQVSYKWCITP